MTSQIEEKKIEGLDNIINHKKKKLPQCNHKGLCPFFFTYSSIGMKNSGKSYSITKLIQLYEKHGVYDGESGEKMDLKTIWISPTSNFDTNSIIYTLKSLNPDDVYDDNVNEDLLQRVFDEIKTEKQMANDKKEYVQAYKKFLSVKDTMKLTDEEVILLSQYDFEKPNIVFAGVKNYIYFLVLDDLISDSNVFNMKRSNFITGLTIKHRHYQICLFYTTQHLKYLPKIIRSNLDLVQIFKSSSNKTIDEYYEMVSNNLSKQEFIELYETATKEKFGSLIINNHQNATYKYLSSWDKYFIINGKE